MDKIDVTVSIAEPIKEAADKLFEKLGLDMDTAVDMFLRQVVKENAIPFRVGSPAVKEGKPKMLKDLGNWRKQASPFYINTATDVMPDYYRDNRRRRRR